MENWIINFRPPRIAMLLVTLAGMLHATLPRGAGYVFQSELSGVGLILVGFTIMVWAWWLFKHANTGVCPTSRDTLLIDYSLYRVTRNPMYLGLVFMLMGIALLMGSVGFYIAALVFFVIINFAFCPYEEKKLADSFSQDYIDYTGRVRRWL